MKSYSITPARFAGLLLALIASFGRCRADDAVTFAVPLLTESPSASLSPEVRLSDAITDPIGHDHGEDFSINHAAIDIFGPGWSFDPDNGISAHFDASEYTLSNRLGMPVPASLSKLSAELEFWHKFSSDWTAKLGVGTGLYGDSDLFSTQLRNNFTVGMLYSPNDQFHAYMGAGASPYYGRTYTAVAAEFYWRLSDRWLLGGGFPKTALSYVIQDNLHVYVGLAEEGGLFNVNSVPDFRGSGGLRFNYDETDLQFGIWCRLAKGWIINLSIGTPVRQRWGYSR